jgi:hypothetical protein
MKTPKTDIEAVELLANEKYIDWISKIREILQHPDSPLSLKNGTWTVIKRQEMWQILGPKLFDEHLDRFKQCVVTVLREPDPQFELPSEKRFAANIRGKVLKHSHALRKGLAESLALLGSQPDALIHCSRGKAETIAITSIREIFKDSDWILWASLNYLLPTLAEAAPEEFLNAVEDALQKIPCPFDEIFSQEDAGIFGNNYMTGLLWALETLAWDEKYLVQVTVILGKLASHDPGGNRGNRPASSLTTIFLPWLPQTIASVDKRKVAIQTLQKEFPAIAWKLLLNLLPNQHQSSMGSHKPVWRKIIPDNWEKGVSNKDYWDQISSYADIAVETAKGDFTKLNELISNLDNLPEPSFNKLLVYLGSAEVVNRSEEERTSLWVALVEFALKHRRYSDADWALSPELVEKIEQVANSLAPQKPQNLYSRLFSERDLELYEEKGDWQEQEKKLEKRRQDAIRKIVAEGGLEEVVQFAETVESPNKVGFSLGFVAEDDTDSVILPDLLETENKKLVLFVSGFVWGRYRSRSWEWIDKIDTANWSNTQIGQFLSYLPFTEKTWSYSKQLLGEHETEYWSRAGVNPYQAEDNLNLAIDKLIQYNRPHAAIFCLYRILHDKKPLDKTKAANALLKAVSSAETVNQMNRHYVDEIIKALQNDPETNQDDLFHIEFAYLPLLTGPGKSVSPKLLEQKLASEPEFFCEAIRLLYRSKNETKSDKEPTEQQKMVAGNVWRLLNDWRTPPGMQPDGSFSGNDFNAWLKSVKIKCEQTGHLEVAMSTLGSVLIHYIPDPSGLWIHKTLAEALNAEDAEKMRNGFSIGIFNSRGVYCVDPTGKPEKELAAKYKQQAEEVENAGYYRFAKTLRSLADSYEDEAKRNIEEHKDSAGDTSQ